MKKQVFLRDATYLDADMLLAWRNDPVTRSNSISEAMISSEKHLQWLNAVVDSPDSRLMIGYANNTAVGVVRLDWQSERDAADISFTVAPEYRGQGYGFALVQSALRDVRNARVAAEVKMANKASIRIFEQLGFEMIDGQGELLMYAKDFC